MDRRTELFWQGRQWYATKLFEIGIDYAYFQFLVEFNVTNEALKKLGPLFERCKLIGMIFLKREENLVQESIANPTEVNLNELKERLGSEIQKNVGMLGYAWDRNVFDLGFELGYLYMCLRHFGVIKKRNRVISISLRDEKDLERIANILKLDSLVKNDIFRFFEKIRPYINDLACAPTSINTSIGKLKIDEIPKKLIDKWCGIIISGCKLEEFFTKWDRRAIKWISLFLTFAVFIGYGVLYYFVITFWGTDPNLINVVIGGIFGISLLWEVYKFVHNCIENKRKRKIFEGFSKLVI